MPHTNGQPQQQSLSHLVAGSTAGCSAVLLLHPFDVVKTRLQVQDGTPGQLPAYRGTSDAIRTICRTEGWRGLCAGLTPSLIGSTASWGAYLYLYERIKLRNRSVRSLQNAEGSRLSAAGNLVSAAEAGAIVCCMTNPIWLVKTRLALQQRSNSQTAATHSAVNTIKSVSAPAAAAESRAYKGVIDALITIGQTEGFRGYYKGFGPSLILQTTHGAVHFAIYEELKHLIAVAKNKHSGHSTTQQLSSADVSFAGAVSKLLASIATYPAQVLRSRLQQRSEGRAIVYNSSWQTLTVTWQREGLQGFYRGLVPSLMRTIPQSAVTLTMYEWLVKVLDKKQG